MKIKDSLFALKGKLKTIEMRRDLVDFPRLDQLLRRRLCCLDRFQVLLGRNSLPDLERGLCKIDFRFFNDPCFECRLLSLLGFIFFFPSGAVLGVGTAKDVIGKFNRSGRGMRRIVLVVHGRKMIGEYARWGGPRIS